MKINHWRELDVYQQAFSLQQAIFRHSRGWPRDEKFSLIDQIRRSSRSIGASISEAWAKRRYPAHFLNKLTDSDAELQETLHWLDTAHACEYLPTAVYIDFVDRAEELGRRLGSMMNNHQKFCF